MNKILSLFVVIFIAIISAEAAQNKRPVEIRKVETDTPYTPTYEDLDGEYTVQASDFPHGSAGEHKWLRVYTYYDSTPEWIDRMTMEFYLQVQPSEKDGEPILFKGSVPYINIPEGRDHIAEMYLHFNTYERFFKRGTIDYAVVALIDGEPVSVKSSISDNTDWFKNRPVHPCGLLNREQTPFRVINMEAYQAIDLCNWNE